MIWPRISGLSLISKLPIFRECYQWHWSLRLRKLYSNAIRILFIYDKSSNNITSILTTWKLLLLETLTAHLWRASDTPNIKQKSPMNFPKNANDLPFSRHCPIFHLLPCPWPGSSSHGRGPRTCSQLSMSISFNFSYSDSNVTSCGLRTICFSSSARSSLLASVTFRYLYLSRVLFWMLLFNSYIKCRDKQT